MANYEAQEILYQALASPLGLVLQVSNFTTANQALYRARAAVGDPALAVLQFRRNPDNPNELWIVKGGKVELPKESEDDASLRE